ncbi:uncharacterized protein LOC122693162 [Cervus elaphus]|uniref:uncharacterized protein LOC122693162 n=1 Tax=Cervus elaphus TaxID=9860 RepID=UPI001CC2DB0C|nr:uncharacterized protein LOC122693162 [Cervus elaphus]
MGKSRLAFFTCKALPHKNSGTATGSDVASTTSAISTTESPAPEHIIVETTPVMIVIIFAVIAGVIGIIIGIAILIKRLKRRSQRQQSILELETSETPKQSEGTEDPEQQPMTGDSTIQASGEVEDKTSAM